MDSTVKSVLFWLAIVIAAFAVYSFTTAQAPTQSTKVAEFQMVVEFADGSLKAKCLKGCAWQTISYGCNDSKVACKAEIDQLGVGGAK